MKLLHRLLTFLDDALYVEVPEQRSPSPDEVISGHLHEAWPCCSCCRKYGARCPIIHRLPCHLASCGQAGDVA